MPAPLLDVEPGVRGQAPVALLVVPPEEDQRLMAGDQAGEPSQLPGQAVVVMLNEAPIFG